MKWSLVVALLVFPQIVFGQESGLVPEACREDVAGCNFCVFVELIKNVVTWLFSILIIVAVGMLVVAGFRLVTSAGNVSAMEGAKSMITNVIIGFVIVLSAWLIVDTLLKALINPEAGFGMWNELDGANCGGQVQMNNDPVRVRSGSGQTL